MPDLDSWSFSCEAFQARRRAERRPGTTRTHHLSTFLATKSREQYLLQATLSQEVDLIQKTLPTVMENQKAAPNHIRVNFTLGVETGNAGDSKAKAVRDARTVGHRGH